MALASKAGRLRAITVPANVGETELAERRAGHGALEDLKTRISQLLEMLECIRDQSFVLGMGWVSRHAQTTSSLATQPWHFDRDCLLHRVVAFVFPFVA